MNNISAKNTMLSLDVTRSCRRSGLSVWQCPQFLFLVMGIFIIAVALGTYSIGTRFIEDPEIVALIVLAMAFILLIIAFAITRSFEKLAEISRLKSEFVDIVSHQLRSPLTNLKWAMSIFNSGEAGYIEQNQEKYLKIISENTERMGELVEDLLMVSRLEQGKLPLLKKDVSLADIAKNVISEFEPMATAADIKIEASFQEGLPKVSTDISQIKLAAENFLSNALKYTKTGGKIGVKVFQRDKGVCFEVKDNGVGIPYVDQKYIFQKFFRSSNSLKEETKGSGLGLYIAKSIIEKSGGEIGFHSKENEGSIFWFCLPQADKTPIKNSYL